MGRKAPLDATSTGKAVKKKDKSKKAKLESSAKRERKQVEGVDRTPDPEHGAPPSAAFVSKEEKETRLKSRKSDGNVRRSKLGYSNERTVGNGRGSSPPTSLCSAAPGTSTTTSCDGSTSRSNGTTGVDVKVGNDIEKSREVPRKRKAGDRVKTTQDQVVAQRNHCRPSEEDQDARLKTTLKFVKAKHREKFGKGSPIVGKDIAALAKLGVKRFVDSSYRGESGTCDGQEKLLRGDDEQGALAVTVRAITAAAKEKHSGKVTLSQFVELFTKEVAAQFGRSKEGPDALLQRALEAEQAGDGVWLYPPADPRMFPIDRSDWERRDLGSPKNAIGDDENVKPTETGSREIACLRNL